MIKGLQSDNVSITHYGTSLANRMPTAIDKIDSWRTPQINLDSFSALLLESRELNFVIDCDNMFYKNLTEEMKLRDDDIKELVFDTVQKSLPNLSPEIRFLAFDQNLVPFASRINYTYPWKYVENSLTKGWTDITFSVLSKMVDDKRSTYIWKIGDVVLSGTLEAGFFELIGACILDVYCDKNVPPQQDTTTSISYQKVSKHGFGFMQTMLCSLLGVQSPTIYNVNRLYDDFDKIHAVPYIPEKWLDIKDLKLDTLKAVWKNLSKMPSHKPIHRKWINGIEIIDEEDTNNKDATRLNEMVERARKLLPSGKENRTEAIGIDAVIENHGNGWNIVKLSEVLFDPGKYEDQANILEIDTDLETGDVVFAEDTIVWAQLSFGLLELYTTIENFYSIDLVEQFLKNSLKIDNVAIYTV